VRGNEVDSEETGREEIVKLINCLVGKLDSVLPIRNSILRNAKVTKR
jgi:hypothetical protein